MDEYISRNELLKDVNSNVAEADNERCSQILEAILNAPTADVVPKSEVEALEKEIERLQKILDSYALQYGTVKEQQDVIDKANQEFAREIFEEIERTFNAVLVGDISDILKVLAELKKKYTEQCPDCKHFVGCEEAVWSGRCEDFDYVRKEDDAYEKGYNDALKDVKEMILERKNENTPKI